MGERSKHFEAKDPGSGINNVEDSIFFITELNPPGQWHLLTLR
jgi:hypothetical protein